MENHQAPVQEELVAFATSLLPALQLAAASDNMEIFNRAIRSRKERLDQIIRRLEEEPIE